jgi:thiol-disulfide isomerase/thioredoxin
MNMRYGVLLVVICAGLRGQQAAKGTRELTVTRSGEGDAASIHLRNEYPAAATAWVLQCETQTGGSRHYWNDQDLSFQSKPIGAGEEIDFKMPQRPPAMMQRAGADTGNCEDFHVAAAVFADGTVTGDLRWINAIVADRRQTYQDIAKAKDILSAAISEGTEAKSVIDKLAEWRKSETPGMLPGAKPMPTHGPSFGWQSQGTAPPAMRMFRSPVPGAALWLVGTQGKSPADASKTLGEWRDRLAKLAPVTESGGPEPARPRMLSGAPFTPPSDSEMVGKPAPEFAMRDVEGREYTLAGLKGKPVLLDFWATWCEPCRESMPHVQKLYEQFKDKGLVVLGVDTNEAAEKARKYFEDNKYSFASLLGSGNDVIEKYSAHSIPRLVLIDKDGVVRYTHTGWGTGMDLTPEVKKLVE